METYKAVMAQIEKLKSKAEQLRQAEIKGVVDRIREAMAHYGLTAEDLRLSSKPGGSAGAGKKGAKKPVMKAGKLKAATKAGAPKYRDPASGKTWTGRGKPPNWIVGISDRSAFLIDAGSGPAAAQPASKKVKPKLKGKARKRTTALVSVEPSASA